jgi:hypothetical protein
MDPTVTPRALAMKLRAQCKRELSQRGIHVGDPVVADRFEDGAFFFEVHNKRSYGAIIVSRGLTVSYEGDPDPDLESAALRCAANA